MRFSAPTPALPGEGISAQHGSEHRGRVRKCFPGWKPGPGFLRWVSEK